MTNDVIRDAVHSDLRYYRGLVESHLNAHVLGLEGPIQVGLGNRVKLAIDTRKASLQTEEERDSLAVVLGTTGGTVEEVERIVNVLRHHYTTVQFFVLDRAMSAGTVLAMSGDEIYMSYYSVLGPIDPQLIRNGRYVPALSYIERYEALKKLVDSGNGKPSDALLLLQAFDQAEIHSFRQQRDLSIT